MQVFMLFALFLIFKITFTLPEKGHVSRLTCEDQRTTCEISSDYYLNKMTFKLINIKQRTPRVH